MVNHSADVLSSQVFSGIHPFGRVVLSTDILHGQPLSRHALSTSILLDQPLGRHAFRQVFSGMQPFGRVALSTDILHGQPLGRHALSTSILLDQPLGRRAFLPSILGYTSIRPGCFIYQHSPRSTTRPTCFPPKYSRVYIHSAGVLYLPAFSLINHSADVLSSQVFSGMHPFGRIALSTDILHGQPLG
jgi:hypothetical protein